MKNKIPTYKEFSFVNESNLLDSKEFKIKYRNDLIEGRWVFTNNHSAVEAQFMVSSHQNLMLNTSIKFIKQLKQYLEKKTDLKFEHDKRSHKAGIVFKTDLDPILYKYIIKKL